MHVQRMSGRIPHDRSEAADPQSNGIAERQIQEIKQATIANLRQSGLPHRYWHYAMKHGEMALNITTRKQGETTPWELRFGEKFKGQLIPLWSTGILHPYKNVVDVGKSVDVLGEVVSRDIPRVSYRVRP